MAAVGELERPAPIENCDCEKAIDPVRRRDDFFMTRDDADAPKLFIAARVAARSWCPTGTDGLIVLELDAASHVKKGKAILLKVMLRCGAAQLLFPGRRECPDQDRNGQAPKSRRMRQFEGLRSSTWS